MSDKPRYVVGFRFYQGDHVVLIEKLKPSWQCGLLNGVGGLVELGESGLQAMQREYLEETGEVIYAWQLFATLDFSEAHVDFYRHAGDWATSTARTTTAEKVIHVHLEDLDSFELVPNLKWLIPLALAEDERTICYAT